MEQIVVQSPRDPSSRRDFDAFVSDINRALERLSRGVAELRGDDGFTPTFRTSISLGGNRIHGVGDTDNDDDACSRGELKRNALYATSRGHEAKLPIIARGGVKVLPGPRANDSALSKKEIEDFISQNAAPKNAQYLVLAANGVLTDERVFTPGTFLDVTDGGAGGAYNIDVAVDDTAVDDLHLLTAQEIDSRIATAGGAYQPLDAILTELSGLADAAGVLTNDGAGNLSWAAGGGAGDDLGNHTATQDLDLATFDIINVGRVYGGGFVTNALFLDPDDAGTTVGAGGVRGIAIDFGFTQNSSGIWLGTTALGTGGTTYTADGAAGSPFFYAHIFGTRSSGGSTIALTNTSANAAQCFLFNHSQRYRAATGTQQATVATLQDEPTFDVQGAATTFTLGYVGIQSAPHFTASGGGTGEFVTGSFGDAFSHFAASIFDFETGWTAGHRIGYLYNIADDSGGGAIQDETAFLVEGFVGSGVLRTLYSPTADGLLIHVGDAIFGADDTPLADLDVRGTGRFTGVVTSTVATGTAPFTVASTTVVANLNASLLQGNAASAFAAASHTHVEADITDLGAYLDQAAADLLYQPLDADLTAIAGLVSAADKVPYFTGAGTAALADFTAFGRTLVANANAADARTDLGLGTMATEAASSYAALAGATFTGNVEIDDEKELRLYEEDANGAHYVALKAPAALAASYTLTLPTAVASAAYQALTATDGAGTLGWQALAAAAISGVAASGTASGTDVSILSTDVPAWADCASCTITPVGATIYIIIAGAYISNASGGAATYTMRVWNGASGLGTRTYDALGTHSNNTTFFYTNMIRTSASGSTTFTVQIQSTRTNTTQTAETFIVALPIS